MSKYTMEEFCEVMKRVEHLQKYQDELYSVQKKAEYGEYNPGFFPSLEDELLDSLARMYDDTDDWINWWVFETGFGIHSAEVTFDSGAKYVIGTSKELYYILNGEWDKLENFSS